MPRNTRSSSRKQNETQSSPAADPTPTSSSSSTTTTTTTATTTSTGPDSSLAQSVRKRPLPVPSTSERPDKMANDDTRSVGSASDGGNATSPAPVPWATRNQWIVLAIASGACAAFNGVFAKLTTNDLTSNISQALAKAFGLTAAENVIELIVRCGFFGLNLVFNGVMWTLFTKALARGSSTTQVSIMNTSTNFVITALLGLAIFSESLPPLWWLGAAMLVAGNVIIGRKEEKGDEQQMPVGSSGGDSHSGGEVVNPAVGLASYGAVPPAEGILPVEKDDEDEDIPLLGEVDESIGR
ncbi:hypothetical protein PFICI_04530 [Pestalotiopsis fici W106-1]|uniref:EamA domain-containing protein n=1 Tax=Pestalotiopsis fici (strain W106-1 / CGMCC3.15140) TaxID=1229662 RepID=W3X9D8_PESFW|nr:uncharacterized protein PFICI_04530 [Pestalotiopsis fici W106-1]ETS82654.1 hypothetical protein PFICI_04530 [Pestalotiopsis fici W106-1]